MPAGKYYCDYCEKEFRDSAGARKRHLQGLQHQRNRSQWYKSINNDQSQYISPNDGFPKGVCHRFLKTGVCSRGDSCKYAHPQQQNLQRGSLSVNNLESQIVGSGRFLPAGEAIGRNLGMSLENLPPSLRPPPEGGYPSLLPFLDWG